MDTKDFDVVAMRTDLHQIPELGFNEHKTSDYVAAKLKEMGLEPIRGIGGTGVVAYIDGTEPGPTVMLRADMDALPFVIDGKDACIHACGHDSHTAMVLATAAKPKAENQQKEKNPFFHHFIFVPPFFDVDV